MTLVPTDERKKKYEKLWNKIWDLIRSTTHNRDNYDEKYIKIKFDSDDDLLLKKKTELHNMAIVIRSAFHEDSKYYPKVFLDKCLYKLWILEYDRFDVSGGIAINKTSSLCKCIICHHWCFRVINVRFQHDGMVIMI